MFRAFMALTALFLLILGASEASAQEYPAYRVIAKDTGNCLKLKAPDQVDDGGLTTAPCQNFADFFVTPTGNPGVPFDLQFRLTSSRWVCIFATDDPIPLPPDQRQRQRIGTRNCAPPTPAPGHPNPPPSLWTIFSPDSDGFQQINKLHSNTDPTDFCVFNNTQLGEIDLDSCKSGLAAVNWKLDPVFK